MASVKYRPAIDLGQALKTSEVENINFSYHL